MAFATTYRHSPTEPVRGREVDVNFDALGKYVDDTFIPLAYSLGVSINLSFTASVSSNALTVAIKGTDGNDPSSSNPVAVPFRSATAASGDMDVISISAATSLVISSGSTLGTTNSTAFKIWLVGFNDGGTFRLGAINCYSSGAIYPLSQFGIASSTAEGGAGGADSAKVFYTGSAVSSKSYTVLGYLTYESGLATAGTWASAPTRVQIFTPQTTLPGHFVQVAYTSSGAVNTTATGLPYDDTIPQNTEGKQIFTLTMTPSSAAHVLNVKAQGVMAGDTDGRVALALFRDSGANAVAVGGHDCGAVNIHAQVDLYYSVLSGTSSSTTFNVRYGAPSGTVTFNGEGGGRIYGGTYGSFMEMREMAT